jgi:HSP20 family molecular chaperone IbpA
MYFSSPYFHQALHPHSMLFGVLNPNAIFEDGGEVAPIKKDNNTVYSPKRSIAYHTVESDDKYKLFLDLPGIKLSDVTVDLEKFNVLKVHAVRKLENDEHITLEQKFYIDRKVANATGATAVLENGVLTIQMAKATKTAPIIVNIKTSSTDSNTKSTKAELFVWTLDLPGVKSSDVQVKYHDDHVTISATRKRGDNIVKIFKKVSIMEEKYNVHLLEAFLVDGVLTVQAPSTSRNESSCGCE